MRRVPYVLLTPAAGKGPRVLVLARDSGAGSDPAAQMAAVRRHVDHDRPGAGVVGFRRVSTAAHTGPER